MPSQPLPRQLIVMPLRISMCEMCVTRPELFPFTTCIFYAVVTAMVSLDRVSLKKRVVDAPEILTVIDKIPNLKPFLNSLYECNYGDFFKAPFDVLSTMCNTWGVLLIGIAADLESDSARHVPPSALQTFLEGSASRRLLSGAHHSPQKGVSDG